MIIKIVFIAVMAFLVGCTPTHWGNYQDGSEPYQTIKLADNLYAFEYAEERSIFIVGEDGIIVTDPLGPKAAKVYKEEIRKISDKPIEAMVYSTSFVHRAGGSEEFDVKRVISHEGCQKNLAATPFPGVKPVNETYQQRYTVDVGGAGLELYHFGESWGTCLSVLIARPSNIMMVPDLIGPAQNGKIVATVPKDPAMANYYMHNIVPFFTEVEQLAAVMGVKQLVGSEVRENAQPLAPVEIIAAQREFWDVFYGTIEVFYKRRVPAMVIPKRADMSVFEKFDDYDKERVQTQMRRGYSLFRIGR